MKSQDIQKTIANSDIKAVCDPHTGDCVSVAVAINSVFGGSKYVCAYQSPVDKIPAHATVSIDGVLYDANGSTSREVLYDIATSGLKKENVWSKQEHISSVSSLTENAYYDNKKDENVREILRDNIE